uniref:Uncharacterized protein n=1 Tax=Scytodes thoracica TaxID=1112478 RepID=A0A0A0V7X2_SCYTH|nr:hypothetical protein [Scytodes thoracica]
MQLSLVHNIKFSCFILINHKCLIYKIFHFTTHVSLYYIQYNHTQLNS